MPFARSPTLSSSRQYPDRIRHAQRHTEPGSPPRRMNTKKINAVSKASLAMLNPAYAMGIDMGPSWYEEAEERQWLGRSGSKNWHGEASSSTFSSSSIYTSHVPQAWSTEPTPELEAFTIIDALPSHSMVEDGMTRAASLDAPTMQRKASHESVFEDDDEEDNQRYIYRRAPATDATPSSGPSTLSRLFTWKRATRMKASARAPAIEGAASYPRSAPSHIHSFDLPRLDFLPGLPDYDTGSLPSTPAGNSAPLFPLASVASEKKIARKSSVPTLRDIRRANGSPLGHEAPLPELGDADAAASFYWRSGAPRTPTLDPSSSMLSITPSSSGGSLSDRSNGRISSVGRGAARKSTGDLVAGTGGKSPRKKRNDAWNMQEMPPLPPISSFPSPISSDDQQSSIQPSLSTLRTRRRSRSVGAMVITNAAPPASPSSVLSPETLTLDTSEAVKGEMHQAVRVALVGRSVIGTASPKLVIRESPVINSSLLSPCITNQQGQSDGPLVVVNVMPPTPDLGALQQETFDGAAASPSVRRSHSQAELTSLVGAQELDHASGEVSASLGGTEVEEDMPNEESTGSCLPYTANGPKRWRNQSGISDFSISTSSSRDALSDTDESMDEPFGFARSLSSMSLSSDSSNESDMSDVGEVSVQSAQLVSATSSTTSFGRAQLVSPRMANVSSWSPLRGLAGCTDSNNTLDSLGSSSSASRRSSKRLSGFLSLSSGQSLASVMTASTSVLGCSSEGNCGDLGFDDGGNKGMETSDLSSPVVIQTQQMADETDCDTPRLSGQAKESTFGAAAGAALATTKPLNVRKVNAANTVPKQSDLHPSTIYSPISPRPYPRAHNATSPHLELDLSLPLDLHEIGLGFDVDDMPRRRENKPRLPRKSRARTHVAKQQADHTHGPTTPPSTTRLLSSMMKKDRESETFGLGLGLGLDVDPGISLDHHPSFSSQWTGSFQRSPAFVSLPSESNIGFAI